MSEDHFGSWAENFSGRSKQYPASFSFEQPLAEIGFELDDLLTQRRLRDVAIFGCAAEIARLGDSKEVTQLV